jgi:hypothetical protein
LPNGNTLIDDGTHGVFTEVTSAGEIVWRYVNPVIKTGPVAQGSEIPLDARGQQHNAVFKIRRYDPDFAGLSGRDLMPQGPLELYPQGTPTPTATPPTTVTPPTAVTPPTTGTPKATPTPTDGVAAWRIHLPLVMSDGSLGRSDR